MKAAAKHDRFVARIRAFMEKENMTERGSRIIVGVSGGADSVCLLRVLAVLAEESGWQLAAVHVNHLIREEAGDDADYVRSLCEELEIPLYLKEADVETLAMQWGMSTEEAGRKVRYQAFEEAAETFGAERIAVAHNQNDRAETLLFHLFRGTGLIGMGSIRPVRERIIRPLLCVSRKEIETWLTEMGAEWCIDRTNHTDEYTRNRIRRHILPYAKEEICSEADVHLAQEAELLAQTADFVMRKAEEALIRCAEGQQSGCSYSEMRINIDKFLTEESFLQTHMLLLVLKQLSNGGKDIGMNHVMDILSLFTGQSGRRVILPYDLEAVRSFGTVIVRSRQSDPEADRETGAMTDLKPILDREGRLEMYVPGLGNVEYSLQNWEKSDIIQEKTYTKWFDYDKIKTLGIRTRQPGDYLTVNDKLQKKSLKEYFIQEKIPADMRADIPLLADGSHIIWVIGHRISSAVKVRESTGRVLRIDIRGGSKNG